MTPEQFCYWLQGRAELVPQPPTTKEWESIVEHLNLVFRKVTSPGPGQKSDTPKTNPLVDEDNLKKIFERQNPYKHSPVYDWPPGVDPYSIIC